MEGVLPMVLLKKFMFSMFLFLGVLIPCAIGSAAISNGDSGDMVYELQDRLVSLHYDIDADGDFGPNTEKVVRRFQQENGLPSNGVVDKTTWETLVRLSPSVSRASRGATGDRIISIARRYMYTPYAFGGTGPGGFDCSGFTQYVFRQAGISLYRMADGQFEQGQAVPESMLGPGDLVFFSTYEPGPSHVGIYVGNGRFIHSGSSTGVTVSSLGDSYWGPRYIGARRVIR